MRHKPASLIFLAGTFALLLAGCREQETIVRYTAPKSTYLFPGVDKLAYSIPEGWKENPKRDAMLQAALQVTEGGATADVTISAFPGPAGGLLANINRWRSQIGLGPVTEEQLKKDAKRIEIAGADGVFVEMVGPEAAGAQREATLGVVHVHNDKTWFVKMRGPADLVMKQKAKFESFVRSVRFDGKTGDKDG